MTLHFRHIDSPLGPLTVSTSDAGLNALEFPHDSWFLPRDGWREAVDGIRPLTREVWRGWSLTQKRRFLRHCGIVDAWREREGGWTWNNWHLVGTVPDDWAHLPARALLRKLRGEGYTLPAGSVYIEDDGYNRVICMRAPFPTNFL